MVQTKRYAANFVCFPQGIVKRYVIEVEKRGRVVNYFPLEKELEQTIWLKGFIILTHSSYSLKQLSSIPETQWVKMCKAFNFITAIHNKEGFSAPLYAYHLSGIDASTREKYSPIKCNPLFTH